MNTVGAAASSADALHTFIDVHNDLFRERKSSMGNRIFVHKRIVSAVERAEFISDGMSYIVLRVRWCNSLF
jgi:hypothetical protein